MTNLTAPENHSWVDEHAMTVHDKWMEYQKWINLPNEVNIKRFWQFTNRNKHKWN